MLEENKDTNSFSFGRKFFFCGGFFYFLNNCMTIGPREKIGLALALELII